MILIDGFQRNKPGLRHQSLVPSLLQLSMVLNSWGDCNKALYDVGSLDQALLYLWWQFVTGYQLNQIWVDPEKEMQLHLLSHSETIRGNGQIFDHPFALARTYQTLWQKWPTAPNVVNFLMASFMTSTTTILHNNSKTKRLQLPDLEVTEKYTCVAWTMVEWGEYQLYLSFFPFARQAGCSKCIPHTFVSLWWYVASLTTLPESPFYRTCIISASFRLCNIY